MTPFPYCSALSQTDRSGSLPASRGPGSSLRRCRWSVVGLLILLWGFTPQPTLAGPYAEGLDVVITGVVTDLEGMPIPDLRVVLKASRKAFNFKKLRRTQDEPTLVAANTDAHGRYEIHWPWHDYYNRFELELGFHVKESGALDFRVLQQDDLSTRVLQGNPVVANEIIEDTEFLNSVRAFLASIDTQDEKRIYEQRGRPDRFESFEAPDHHESTWWYFPSGRAYRFRDGSLEQVIDFEPIAPFPGEGAS